jgi:hypothetical protein
VKLIVRIVANYPGGGLEQVARVAVAHVIGRVSATLLRLHHGSWITVKNLTTYSYIYSHFDPCVQLLLHIQVSAGNEPRKAGAEMSCMPGAEMSCMPGAEMFCIARDAG